MDADYISEDEFWNDWEVIQKASGELFEFEDVKNQPLNHVWTIIETGDDDNESWYASPGFHIVNRMGYVMTKRPWVDDLRDAVYFLHEDIDDGTRKIFLYRCNEVSGCVNGAVLLFGEDEIADDVIRENCDDRGCFMPERAGVPTLSGQVVGNHLSYEYCGLRDATDEETESLPLWGSLKELVRKFRAINDTL